MTIDLSLLMKEAEETARGVGKALALDQETLGCDDRKEGRDIKVRGDLWADERIRECLKKWGYPVYSEERESLWETKGPYWVVDPLDGSYNYHANIPFFAVSIALWEGDIPLLGVVHHISGKETFSAFKGGGLFFNGEKFVRPDDLGPVDILCTGIPVSMILSTENLAAFSENLKRFKKIRMLGSASLMLAYTAFGRASAYEEKSIMFWDVAAGLALCSEAGLKIEIDSLADLKLSVRVSS